MKQLIEALTILLKYGDPPYPTHCEHDEMTIVGIHPASVSVSDRTKLYELGFFVSGEGEEDDDGNTIADADADQYFKSFRFGSA